MGTLGINNVAAKTAHVNLMTDTVIANLNAESLRAVIRSMLAGDQEGQLTNTFQKHVQSYLRRDIEIRRPLTPPSFATAAAATATATATGSSATANDGRGGSGNNVFHQAMEDLNHLRMRILALLGCGLAFEGLGIVAEIVRHSAPLMHRVDLAADEDTLLDTLAAVDADMVQCLTAIQSHFILPPARAQLGDAQVRALVELKQSLDDCRRQSEAQQTEFIYERGMDMLDGIFGALKR